MGQFIGRRLFALVVLTLIQAGCSPKILSGLLPGQSGLSSSGVSQSIMVVNPPILQADGSSTSQITVTLEDTNGNPVVGKSVTLFSSRGSLDSIPIPSSVSDEKGNASFFILSTHAGSSILTATDTTDHLPISSSANLLFLPGSVIPSQTTLVSSLTTVVADGTSNSQVTVTLKDAQGNGVTGKSVLLSSSRGGDVISPSMGTTDASGRFSFSVSSTQSGVSVFTAIDVTDSLTFPEIAQVIFTSGVSASLQSTVSASPTFVSANGTSTSTITVSLKDAQGNPVPNKAVTLSSSRGAQDMVSSASGPSNSSGIVTFTVKSTVSGSATFTALDTTDSVTINQTGAITFVATLVSASQSTVSASPLSILANGSATSTVTVTLKDSAGNPVSGKSVTLTSSRGANDTISSPSGTSSASGVVTFTVASNHAGSSTFTAIDSTDSVTISQTAGVTFTAGGVSSSQSTVSASPSSVAADGSSTSTITITLLDANSNPVSGKTVTLSSSRGVSDSISNASGSSNSLGQVTFTVTSSTLGTSTLTATDTTDSVTVSQTVSVSFIAGATSPSTSTVNASPILVSGNGSATSTVTITLLDANSHPVSGKTVSLTSNRGSSDTLSPSNSTSDSNGQVVFTVLSSTVGDAILTAQNTTESVTLNQTAAVHFYGNLSSSSKMIATPASIPADNSSQSTITIILLDSTSTPIPGKLITLSSSRGSLDTITTTSGTTNASGQATFTLKSNKIGMPVLTATDTSDGVTINQTFRIQVLGSGTTPQTDYRSDLANQGYLPGNNTLPVSTFQNVEASGYNGTLYSFGYTTSSGWAGDGSLLTSGALGPNRLVFNGTSNYLDLGPSINSNSSYSFEAWMRPTSPTTSDAILLSTNDSSNNGFALFQLPDGSGRISLAPAVYSQVILANNPTLYWKLDETSGTLINDSSGNGNTGTYYPAGSTITLSQPSLIADSRYSATFSGYSGGTTAYSNAYLTSSAPMTEEIWFQTTTTSGGSIVECGDTQTGQSHSYDRIIYMTNSGALYFGNYTSEILSSGTYNDGKAHHAVGVFDSSGLSFYIDGALIGNTSNLGSYSSSCYWRIGGDNLNAWQNRPNSDYFNGSLDEFAIYPSALTAAQIQEHFLSGTQTCVSQSAIPTNVWSHIASVFSSVNNTASLYLNGNQQCSIPLSGMGYSGSSSDLTAGSSPSQTNFWSGAIAGLKTYAQALTSSLIQKNYAATAAQLDIQQLGEPTPIMWLKADAIQGLSDGASVSTWPDSSANGNNASQGTANNQPVWKKNIINGHPVVRFDGSSSYMNGPSVFPTTADYTVIVVSKVNNTTQNNVFIGAYGGSTPDHLFFLQQNAYLSIYHGSSNPSATSNLGVTINQFFIASATYQYSSSQVKYYLNGSPVGNATQGAINTDSTLQIGTFSNYAGFNDLNGDIAEIFLFGSALSNNDRMLIETYLNAKYGIF